MKNFPAFTNSFRLIITVTALCFLCFGAKAQMVSDTSLLKMTTALDNTFLCPGKGEVYLNVDIKSFLQQKRQPLNISVVFDRSGSMEGERIEYAREAMDYLIDHFQPADKMSIVIYDHEAEILHGSEPVTDRNHLKKKIHHIVPRGHTNISAGLELGIREVKSTYDSTNINRVFLLTDGLANEGITDDYILEQIVKGVSRKNNITFSTFGLGHEYNETLLHDLAEAGAGHYYHIGNPADVATDFGQEIKTLLSVAAQNAKLLIEFPNDQLDIVQVYGQYYTMTGNSIMIDMKEIHPNEQSSLLVKFKLKPGLTISSPVTFTSSLFYTNAITGTRGIIRKENLLTPSANNNDCEQHVNNDVLDKVVFFSSNALFESAMDDAENNNKDAAKKKITQGKKLLQDSNKNGDNPLFKDQITVYNEYEQQIDKHGTADKQKMNVINKYFRHKNYKVRKQKKQTPNQQCPTF